MAKKHPSFWCPAGALLKRCTAKSTNLPSADVRCYPPGAVLSLLAAPEAGPSPNLTVVEPVFASSSERIGMLSSANATRGHLSGYLEGIGSGTAPLAMVCNGSAAGLPLSVLQLAQVVTRHAAVMRQRQGGPRLLAMMGLRPYGFTDA